MMIFNVFIFQNKKKIRFRDSGQFPEDLHDISLGCMLYKYKKCQNIARKLVRLTFTS